MLRRGYCPDEDSKIVQRLRDNDLQLYTDYCGMRNCLRHILPFMSMNIKYYTDHGIDHTLRVIEVLDELITDEVLKSMTDPEIYILLCGVWLHDIGMLLDHDPATDRELEEEDIRKEHNKLSRGYIIKNFERLKIRDENTAEIIGDICLCHSRDEDINSLEEKDYLLNEEIRPQFMAALLRLADALDLRGSRAPGFIPDDLMVMPIESQLNWKVYKLLTYARPQPGKGRIFIAAWAKDEDDQILLKWKIRDIWEEFKSIKHIIIKNRLIYRRVRYKFKGDKRLRDASDIDEKFTLLKAKLGYWDSLIRKHEDRIEKIKKYKAKMEVILENLRAADLSFQAARECEFGNEKDEALNYYEKTASFLDIGENTMYFSIVFRKYCELKKEKLSKGKLPTNETMKQFIYHMETRILPALKFIRTKTYSLKSDFLSLKILCRSCLTEERREIKNAVNEIKFERLPEKVKGVHGDCCFCTARLISTFVMLGKHEEINNLIEWLSKQNENIEDLIHEEDITGGRSEGEYRVKGFFEKRGHDRMSYVYTAETLEAFLDISDIKKAKNAADVLTCNINRWLDKTEQGKLEAKAIILYALYRYVWELDLERVKKNKKEERNNLEIEINNVIYKIMKEIRTFQEECRIETNTMERMVSLRGLLFWRELREYERKSGKAKLSCELEKTAHEIASDLVDDAVWAEDGSWGYNHHVTCYTIWGLLAYWEYVLKGEIRSLHHETIKDLLIEEDVREKNGKGKC